MALDQDDLDAAVVSLRQVMVHTKRVVDKRVTEMAAGNVEHREFDALLVLIAILLNTIDEVSGLTGIQQFIKNHYGNQAINLASHAAAITGAAEAAASRIRSDAPTGAQSYVLGYTYNANPRAEEPRVWRQYTTAQTANLRTDLAALSSALGNFFASLRAAP